MGNVERTYAPKQYSRIEEVLISADSHVIEPEGLWVSRLPKEFQGRAPGFGGPRPTDSPGAQDRAKRVEEMAIDRVSAEVLYPTHGTKTLILDDHPLEEACAVVYNDWLTEYCSAAPKRLVGLAMIPVYRIDFAIAEMERCRKAGLRGAVIWQVPAPEIPFTSDHYEQFWAAAQDLDMPVSLHILSGHGYNLQRTFNDGRTPNFDTGIEQERTSVNRKLVYVMDALYDLVFSGVLERFPKLKIVLAENEIGWLPFVLEQWDYYYQRHGANRDQIKIKMSPSEDFHRQVYPTFFNDAVGARMLSWWGSENCMWSSDYPHGNTTWPNSMEVVARDMGELRAETREQLLRGNAARLYGIDLTDLD